MDCEVKIIKGIPKEQIERFEDRVVYYTAIATREYTKGRRGYPYRTGKLEREEVAAPVQKLGNNQYGLLAGTNYAHYVYNMTNVNWTNKSTLPQWYHTAYKYKGASLVTNATIKALKEISK